MAELAWKLATVFLAQMLVFEDEEFKIDENKLKGF